MKTSKLLTLVFVIAAGIAIFAIFKKDRPAKHRPKIYKNGPYVFNYSVNGPAGVVAKLMGKEVSAAELVQSSEPLNEIYNKQAELILEGLEQAGALKVSGRINANNNDPAVTLNLPHPVGAESLQSKYKVHIKFEPNYQGEYLAALEGRVFLRKDIRMNQLQFSALQTQAFYTQMRLLREMLERMFAASGGNAESDTAEFYFHGPEFKFPVNESAALNPINPKDKEKTVYIFSNFDCGPCQNFAKDLTHLRQKYAEKINFAFFNFFTDSGWLSPLMAEAAVCLNYQNENFFWNFVEKVAEASRPFDEPKVDQIAKDTGADFERYRQCLNVHEGAAKMKAQLMVGRSLSVSSAPTVIVGDQVFSGIVPIDQFASAMDQLVEQGAQFQR